MTHHRDGDDAQALRAALATAGLPDIEPTALAGATAEVTIDGTHTAPLDITAAALTEDGDLVLHVAGELDGVPVTTLQRKGDTWHALDAARRTTGSYRITVTGAPSSPAHPSVHCGADIGRT